MNTIEFYNRYYQIASERLSLDFNRKDMSEKEIRIRESELIQKTNVLFNDYLGSNLNILA